MKKIVALLGMFSLAVLSTNILLSTYSHASNFRFLNNSVLTRFTAAESQDFRAFVASTLDKAKDHQVLSWASKHSKLRGRLKVDFSYETDTALCRRSLFIIQDDKGQAERFQFEICKQGGEWSIQDTPARNFQESDWDIQRKHGLQVLESSQQGVPLSWHNPKTGNSGVITSTATENDKHGQCRQLAISIFDKNGQSSNGVYWMCLQGDGNWQRDVRDNWDDAQ